MGEEQHVQRPQGELISWTGEVWEVRGYARTQAEEGHELTAVLGGEEAGIEKGSGSRWRLYRMRRVRVRLGPDGGANRHASCSGWARGQRESLVDPTL